MPPRAPSQDEDGVDNVVSTPDDDSNGVNKASSGAASNGNTRGAKDDEQASTNNIITPSTAAKSVNTFHWELNLYSFTVLGLIYFYVVPERHRPVMHILFGLIAVDAARYYYNLSHMSGVPYTLPFVSIIAMVINPIRFWSEMGKIAMANDGFCGNTLLGKFLVFCTDPAACREVFTTESRYALYAHPNAKWLFGTNNLIYLQHEPHKRVRAILTPALFSEKALNQYAHAQERVAKSHLQKLAVDSINDDKRRKSSFNAMVAFRSLGAASSQEAFLGPYLTPELRVQLERDILAFTMGFLSFPFPYAGGLKQAIAGKNRIEEAVLKIVPTAQAYVKENCFVPSTASEQEKSKAKDPRCLLEQWILTIMTKTEELGQEPEHCSDENVANTVMDFLFAAQDATNSALTYALDILEAHPAVLDKMHHEVTQVVGKSSSDGSSSSSSTAMIAQSLPSQLPYISAVANELLHHRPPVPMVPHISLRSGTTLGGHVLPAGSVVIPSITYSCRVNGTSLEFLPNQRTSPADRDLQFLKSCTFGAGQHKCPGRRYAESLLTVFLAVVAQEYQVHRTGPRPGPDDFVYYPTLFPKDSNFILTKRASNGNSKPQGAK